MRRLLKSVGVGQIVASSQVARARLLILFAILRALAPLPRLSPAARWLSERLS